MVENEAIPRVKRALEDAGGSHQVEVEDVLDLVRQERQHMEQRKKIHRRKRQGKTIF